MNKKYLREEKNKNINKVLMLVFILIIIGGLTLTGFGVSKIIKSSKIAVYSPASPQCETDINIDDKGWFEAQEKAQKACSEARKEKMKLESAGLYMIIPGIFLIFTGAIGISILSKRNILDFQIESIIPVTQKKIEEVAPEVNKPIKEDDSNNKIKNKKNEKEK